VSLTCYRREHLEEGGKKIIRPPLSSTAHRPWRISGKGCIQGREGSAACRPAERGGNEGKRDCSRLVRLTENDSGKKGGGGDAFVCEVEGGKKEMCFDVRPSMDEGCKEVKIEKKRGRGGLSVSEQR